MKTLLARLAAAAIAFSVVACAPAEDSGADAGTTDGGRKPRVEIPDDGPPLLAGKDCDPLVPTHCGFPFPSDVYLVEDAVLPSGKRVAFGAKTLPKWANFAHMDRTLWADSDGWSPGQAPLTHFPTAIPAKNTHLPTQDTIDASLAAESPTVLIEAETGTRVPHWSEFDLTTGDDTDRAFIVRPVIRLKDHTRYIVAIRGIKDGAGKAIEPVPAFKALRDGSESEDPTVEARRALYTDIFDKLAAAGIAKDDLQIAWDYTTATRENNTRWMLDMRDKAFAAVGEDGPEYRIVEVKDNPNEHIRRRIEGMMRAPLFLTNTSAVDGRLRLGADGMPEQNGWAEFPFTVQIPHKALETPGAILAQGHGLLGRRSEGQNGYLAQLQNAKNYVSITMDLIGMAEEDEAQIVDWATTTMEKYRISADRQHQGMVNQLLAMRMMKGRFATEPQTIIDGKNTIDPDLRFYRGDSQGGIMGATYMALSPDVERGYLGEPGMPYNLLLNRSVDFDQFLIVLQNTYPTARDLQLVLGAIQMFWDRVEPTGYVPYITGNNLPGVLPKQVLINVAIGDYQVTPLGAHIMARAVGAKHLKQVVRQVWGLEEADGPLAAGVSAMQEFDFGLPEVPKGNVPPKGDGFPEDKDPHDEVRKLPAVFDQTDKFLREGVIQSFCEGKCDPE